MNRGIAAIFPSHHWYCQWDLFSYQFATTTWKFWWIYLIWKKQADITFGNFQLILFLCSFNSMACHFKYLLDIRSCYFPAKKKWDIYSTSGEGNGIPLQYSCLENPMDGGAWWAAVHGVAKSPAPLSNFTFTFHCLALEKEMAAHSSVLAWRIPGTREPGGLPSLGSHRVRHDWRD